MTTTRPVFSYALAGLRSAVAVIVNIDSCSCLSVSPFDEPFLAVNNEGSGCGTGLCIQCAVTQGDGLLSVRTV